MMTQYYITESIKHRKKIQQGLKFYIIMEDFFFFVVSKQLPKCLQGWWSIFFLEYIQEVWISQVALVVKNNLPDNAGATGDAGSIPGSGRSRGGGNGNPLQYSYLENSMDRGALQATVHGVANSWT